MPVLTRPFQRLGVAAAIVVALLASALSGIIQPQPAAANPFGDAARNGAVGSARGAVPANGSAWVRSVQNDLNRHGFPLTVDGYWGHRTETAVEQFQAKAGLTTDGLVGKLTQAALNRPVGDFEARPVERGAGRSFPKHNPVEITPAGPGKQRIFMDREASAAFIVGAPLATDHVAVDALEAWSADSSGSGLALGFAREILGSYVAADKWRIAGNRYYQEGKCLVIVTDAEGSGIHAWDIDKIGWHVTDHNCRTGPNGPSVCLTDRFSHAAGIGCPHEDEFELL